MSTGLTGNAEIQYLQQLVAAGQMSQQELDDVTAEYQNQLATNPGQAETLHYVWYGPGLVQGFPSQAPIAGEEGSTVAAPPPATGTPGQNVGFSGVQQLAQLQQQLQAGQISQQEYDDIAAAIAAAGSAASGLHFVWNGPGDVTTEQGLAPPQTPTTPGPGSTTTPGTPTTPTTGQKGQSGQGQTATGVSSSGSPFTPPPFSGTPSGSPTMLTGQAQLSALQAQLQQGLITQSEYNDVAAAFSNLQATDPTGWGSEHVTWVGPGSTSVVDAYGLTTAQEQANQTQAQQQYQSNVAADSIVNQVLQQYGLGDLAGWAWSEITNGASSDQVLLDMYNQPAFKARFPGIFQRQQAGLPAISPADYIAYEDQAKQLENQYGLPSGFLSNSSRIGNLIGQDVGMPELTARIQDGFAVVANAPTEVQQAFSSMFGAKGASALASYFIDSKTATPLLEQQATSADIAGRASDVGFGLGEGMDKTMALRLAQLGVTGASSESALQDLASKRGLFTQQMGEASGITNTQGLQAEFGLSPDAQRKLQQEEEMRQAEFSGGGGAQVETTGTSIGAARPF